MRMKKNMGNIRKTESMQLLRRRTFGDGIRDCKEQINMTSISSHGYSLRSRKMIACLAFRWDRSIDYEITIVPYVLIHRQHHTALPDQRKWGY